MPKTKEERVLYCRQWRKISYDEKRFNKTVREYVEIKYKHIFSECTKFYEAIVKTHPKAKDVTKSKTFKQWKKAARVEEMPEPARVEEMPEPAGVEEMPEPARVEEIPEPARVEEMPEPTRNILDQALGELNIDQLDNRVQGMMEDLQQDPAIRALLNNEELFPPCTMRA